MDRPGEGGQRGPAVGLEHLSLRDEPLGVFVTAAAAAGAASVCLSVNHPDVRDRKTLGEAVSQLAALNLPVAMADGFVLRPDEGLDGLSRRLEVLLDVGAPVANAFSFEPDEHRRGGTSQIEDLLGEFCRVAGTAGIEVLLEFTPLGHVPSLAAAAELAKQLDQPNLRILVDTLHLARAGEGPDDVRNVDHRLIGYCQLSDGSRVSESRSAYVTEAVAERVIPGHGELPLTEVLSAVSRDVIVSAEVPLRRLSLVGISPDERARLILDASRRIVARARA